MASTTCPAVAARVAGPARAGVAVRRVGGAQRAAAHRRTAVVAAAAVTKKICVLPGDGIGPEISAVAVDVLKAAGEAEGVAFEFEEALIGGAAIDATGEPYPAATFEACKRSDAVLLAAIGG
jgi:isocitrate dehydrogenase